MGDGKIIDRIFADALSQMEPGGAAPQAPAGDPGEEKEQTMENDTGAPAEDLPPAGGDDEEDLDTLLENLTQNAEEPPAAEGDRDLDEVLDEMFPDGPAAAGAEEPASGPAGASPLDDLMASAMDIEDMPALDEAPEDAPAPADDAPEAPAPGLGDGLGGDGEEPAPAGDDADLAAMAADLEAAGALPAGGADDGLSMDGMGDDLTAQAPDDAAGVLGADDLPGDGLEADGELETAAPKKKARARKKTKAHDAEESDEARPAAEPLPDDLADLAAAAAAAEKEEGVLGAGAAPASDDDALAAMAAMAGGEEAMGAPVAGAETGAADDAALRSMGLDGPDVASAATPGATENPAFVADEGAALADADKERLLAHLAARFDVLARRKLHNLPASQVRLIRSVNLRVDIELKFGEFSASGDDDSLFRLDE